MFYSLFIKKSFSFFQHARKYYISIMTDHLSRETLISRASDLKVIPTLNGIMEKVLQVLGNNNSSFNDLSQVVPEDMIDAVIIPACILVPVGYSGAH